ncbi:hypothetical protein [Micromonospora sp. CB01531]|uniref:hypothetical protein n=1 Tax=Micromonospora sp. CB01531 TaxID=1718947 RepID=UPI000A5E9C3C|nr:hypothetical protein [Micromonospora sp. CB01531]
MPQPTAADPTRDTGPRNLDPQLDALGHRLEHAALVRIPDPATATGKAPAPAGEHQVLRFQYNPETLTRTRQGNWEARKLRRSGVSPPQEARTERGGMGSGAVNAESEQISFKLVFDATEAILAGRADAGTTGVLPELAFLEIGARGRENPPAPAPAKAAARPGQKAQPVRPDEMLLVVGGRAFPVVITSLTITEQKFLPTLVPVRAEVELRLTVLESGESAYRQWISTSFTALMKQRTDAAAVADFGGSLKAVTDALTTAFSGGTGGTAT